MPDQIVIDLSKTLFKTYSIRPAGSNTPTVLVSIPREPLEREARNLGLTLEEFMDRYEAEWHFDGFPGLYMRYKEK